MQVTANCKSLAGRRALNPAVQVTINSKELAAALKQHAKVCKSRKFMAILNDTVYMSASGDKLTLTSTDLTMFLRTRHECATTGATVPVLVAVSALRKALQAIKGQAVLEFPVVAGPGSVLTVRGGGAVFHLASLDPVCFPEYPVYPAGGVPAAAYTFFTEDYTAIMAKVTPSIEQNKARRLEFQGVIFRQREQLQIMASDSRRVARVTLDGTPATPGDWIIPAAAVNCFIPTGDDVVGVSFDADYCLLINGNTELITLLIGAEFPAVDEIIPASFDHSVVINRDDLAAALATLGAKRSGKDGGGVITLDFGFAADSVLHLATADKTAATTVHYDGDAGDVRPAFFGNYLLDGVTACDPVARIQFNDDTMPVLLTGDKFLYLVMPHHRLED